MLYKKIESKKVEKALEAAHANLRNLIEQQNSLERFSRRNNVRLVGYVESYNEALTEPMTIVKRVLDEKFHMSDVIIEKAHRTGKRSARPRQIIFKLQTITRIVDYLFKIAFLTRTSKLFVQTDS